MPRRELSPAEKERLGMFGAWLRNVRVGKYQTQAAVAAALGVSTLTENRLEMGKERPSASLVKRMAKWAKIDVKVPYGILDQYPTGGFPRSVKPEVARLIEVALRADVGRVMAATDWLEGSGNNGE